MGVHGFLPRLRIQKARIQKAQFVLQAHTVLAQAYEVAHTSKGKVAGSYGGPCAYDHQCG